ncbi:MAG: hypothetical protein K8W52_13125 [Deltaproteobacteria bacterium]|nr:hypothetical protein [Deltaproteobacteria bacterium]
MVRLGYWLGFAVTLALGLASGDPRRGAMVAVMWILLGALLIIVAPRAAHAAFVRGQFGAARWRYQLLARLSPTEARRSAARISVGGCRLATGDVDGAERELARVELADLDAAARVAWLNNRAYAALTRGGDPAPALAWSEEAARLRPDVPGVMHTRGKALLAAGDAAAAIQAFESMWSLGELAPRLEAERCRDLGRAWDALGHRDYADDYRARAARVWPVEGAPAVTPPTGFVFDDA